MPRFNEPNTSLDLVYDINTSKKSSLTKAVADSAREYKNMRSSVQVRAAACCAPHAPRRTLELNSKQSADSAFRFSRARGSPAKPRRLRLHQRFNYGPPDSRDMIDWNVAHKKDMVDQVAESPITYSRCVCGPGWFAPPFVIAARRAATKHHKSNTRAASCCDTHLLLLRPFLWHPSTQRVPRRSRGGAPVQAQHGTPHAAVSDPRCVSVDRSLRASTQRFAPKASDPQMLDATYNIDSAHKSGLSTAVANSRLSYSCFESQTDRCAPFLRCDRPQRN